MITRACISINNKCNLNCLYCHFHEKSDVIKEENMDILKILINIINYIDKYKIEEFKLGFVGNGEPLLNFKDLTRYITILSIYIEKGIIKPYTITNGLLLDEDKMNFMINNKVNIWISLDGPKWIQDKYRCNSFDKTMEKIQLYNSLFSEYPSLNATVGKETIENAEEVITFFERFKSRITFSRMIGNYGISLNEFHEFLEKAKEKLNVRTGGYDCTMYGGLCAVGLDNIFYANGKIYRCGNCIDLPPICDSDTSLDKIEMEVDEFDRHFCYKEIKGENK